ncbi:hypothetical protein CDAR_237461 [Caerostris darwini]|uniref:Uncharacterized protein n=1 Tax=Caerostris darwini TaxID=1538125 RepID=A0AAV4QRB6_9ARAC|nr:hypothetical protein CDAR_237461 [Caerostris darwini]
MWGTKPPYELKKKQYVWNNSPITETIPHMWYTNLMHVEQKHTPPCGTIPHVWNKNPLCVEQSPGAIQKHHMCGTIPHVRNKNIICMEQFPHMGNNLPICETKIPYVWKNPICGKQIPPTLYVEQYLQMWNPTTPPCGNNPPQKHRMCGGKISPCICGTKRKKSFPMYVCIEKPICVQKTNGKQIPPTLYVEQYLQMWNKNSMCVEQKHHSPMCGTILPCVEQKSHGRNKNIVCVEQKTPPPCVEQQPHVWNKNPICV